MSSPRVHGLVIGIDRYGGDAHDAGHGFEDLEGSVRDARKVHEFLIRELGLPTADLRLLTASRGLSPEPREAEENRPGYRQMVEALREIGRRAAPGDLAFVYFSGHGVRRPSQLPGRTEPHECLVPCDVHRPEGQVLHDVELGYLVHELEGRGVDTVVVLDACFCGGALRAEPRVRVRGTSALPPGAPLGSSGVASLEALTDFASQVDHATRRHTLLAACAAHEVALEAPLGDGRVGGLFTAALLAALRRTTAAPETYRQLIGRVRAALWTTGSRQTPQAQGAVDRTFLGRTERSEPSGIGVLAVDAQGALHLAAGSLHGLSAGALFRFPLAGPEPRVFEAKEVDDSTCRAEPVDTTASVTLEPGEQVGLLCPAPWRLLLGVRLVAEAAAVPGLSAALDAPAAGSPRFLRVLADGESADFRVEVTREGEFSVLTRWGEELALGPPLAASEPGSTRELARRLAHVARFEALRKLHNPVAAAEWEEPVTLEIDGRPAAPGAPLEVGRRMVLRAVNRSDRVLYVAILSLGADWSVEQLWPRAPWAALEPGQGTPELAMIAELPDGFAAGRATLKAFASEWPASFDWLELPPLLACSAPPLAPKRAPSCPLEELLAAWTQNEVSTSSMVRSAAGGWSTVAWEVSLRRSPPPGSSG